MDDRYCGSCKFLSLTEEQQAELRKIARIKETYLKEPHEFHWCNKFGKRVKHNGKHPLLPKLQECLESK